MSKYFMGLDYGTGGMKACITDDELNVYGYAFREYRILSEHSGYSEHIGEDYWIKTCEAIRECLLNSRVDKTEILGISISCAMPSLVMLNKQGQVIHRAYNLMDRRATKQADWIRYNIGTKRYFQIDANRIEDHHGVVNLMWERENRPEEYKNIYKALSVAGFIKFRLTGLFNESCAVASFLGAFNIRKKEFDQQLLEEMGLQKEIFGEVTPCETVVGTITSKAAEETGLSTKTLVISGHADACAGWIGAGAIHNGDMQMNLGTSGNFGIVNERNEFNSRMGINAIYTDTQYVVIPSTMTGGQSLRYLRDNFSPLERAIEAEANISAYELLNREAQSIPEGSEGLIMLPYLMGERSPFWNPGVRGSLIGLSLNHTKAHLVRAMMEGVAYALYLSYEEIKNDYQINYPIVLNEGGAVSDIWRTIITNVFNVPTALVKNRGGAPYGNCVLAAKACGAIESYEIARQKAEYVKYIEPDEKKHNIYMEYFEVYKQAYIDLENTFERLSDIRRKYNL